MMKNYQIKLGFIGGSLDSIAGYPHLVACQMDNRFKVVAGAFSRNKEINRKTGIKYNVSKVYNDWKSLIENEKDELDAVVVLVPTPMHAEVISILLQQKMPVISEKALVSSLSELDEIKKYYNKDSFLVVTNNYSGYSLVRELREIIKKGTLGKIINLDFAMPQESFLRPPRNIKYPQKWRLKDSYIPTICLDLGVHLHHLSYFLTEMEPISVFGHFNSFSKYPVFDDVKLLLKYPNNATGSFWISKTALGNRNGLACRIYGEKGSAGWFQEEPEKIHLAFNDGSKTILDRSNNLILGNIERYSRMIAGHPSGFIEAFANMYYDIADVFMEFSEKGSYHNPYVYGMLHAENGLKLFHFAKQSFEKNKRIKLK